MRISISGTPAVGKTSVSKKLAEKLNYEYVNVNELAREKDLVVGKAKDIEIIDEEKLKDVDLNENVVLDGHLSHFIPCDVVFVLRLVPDELKKRLERKDWNRKKIKENLEAEILGICSYQAREENEEVYEIDTTGLSKEEVVEKIMEIIHEKDSDFKTEIDWMKNYGDWLKP